MGTSAIEHNTNANELQFSNLNLFYQNLYSRLFELLNNVIDENQYNIRKLKDEIRGFTDDYSYYIIGKKMKNIKEKEKETTEKILETIREHDQFTSVLNNYPSKDYILIRRELIKNNYNLNSLGKEKYNLLVREYYSFFVDIVNIIKSFVAIASVNGFLPVIRSNSSLKQVGFNNYNYFFQEFENLKMRLRDITTSVHINNLLKSRRAIYILLMTFEPYYKKKEVFQEIFNNLDFSFLQDDETLKLIQSSYQYTSIDQMGYDDQKRMLNLIQPLSTYISLAKRYLSREFGEAGMSPIVKEKYNEDPFWT